MFIFPVCQADEIIVLKVYSQKRAAEQSATVLLWITSGLVLPHVLVSSINTDFFAWAAYEIILPVTVILSGLALWWALRLCPFCQKNRQEAVTVVQLLLAGRRVRAGYSSGMLSEKTCIKTENICTLPGLTSSGNPQHWHLSEPNNKYLNPTYHYLGFCNILKCP